MRPNVLDLLLVLFSIGIHLQALRTQSKQLEHLLSDVLPRRPPEAVVLFAKALIETGQGHHLENIGVRQEDMDYIKHSHADLADITQHDRGQPPAQSPPRHRKKRGKCSLL